MSEIWEFNTTKDMLDILIGESFGPNPENKLRDIISEKRRVGRAIIELLKLSKTEQVLEIGSGCGYMSALVAHSVGHLTCCDISQSFLEVAKKECAANTNMDFFKLNSHEFPFLDDASLDAAYSYNVFIHLNLFDIHLYLQELSRVLKPGGKLWFDAETDRRFSEGLPAGFTDMAAEYLADRERLGGLIHFNSEKALLALAKHHGFELSSEQMYRGSFYFEKT